MTEQECSALLAEASFGRLGCSWNDQPYVVPICFVYEANYFYALSTLGQKIEWMRKNPKVCIQVDEVASETRWASVIANGHFQELAEPGYSDERAHARKLVAARPQWWRTPIAERQLKKGDDSIAPVLFRVHLDSMSGLRAVDATTR